MEDLASLRLGFVGTGAITSAIVTGLCSDRDPGCRITVSPRNHDAAARLATAFPQVRVAGSNQEVIDQSDVVFLAVRPQVAPQVLASVEFAPGHRIISLIATFSRDDIAARVRPAATITCAVPLPSVAARRGPTAIFPADPVACALFNRLGVAVEAKTEAQFQALWASTAMMAPYFTLLGTLTSWLGDHGVPPIEARGYIAMLFSGLGLAQQEADATFAELAQAHRTKGGLNEQCEAALEQDGVFDACSRALDAILARIQR